MKALTSYGFYREGALQSREIFVLLKDLIILKLPAVLLQALLNQ